MPTGVPAASAVTVKRSNAPTQISPIRSVRATAAAASPPKNAATAGAAPTAMPPSPMHSMTAESPMSQRGVVGAVAVAQQRVLDWRRRAR